MCKNYENSDRFLLKFRDFSKKIDYFWYFSISWFFDFFEKSRNLSKNRIFVFFTHIQLTIIPQNHIPRSLTKWFHGFAINLTFWTKLCPLCDQGRHLSFRSRTQSQNFFPISMHVYLLKFFVNFRQIRYFLFCPCPFRPLAGN